MRTRLHVRRPLKVFIGKAVRGCGTTHTALAVANHLASKERYRVLYIECVERSEPEAGGILGFRTDTIVEVCGQQGFRRSGVDFIPRCLSSDSASLMALSDYEAIVLEADGRSERIGLAAAQCGTRLWIGSAKPWRYRELQEFVESFYQKMDIVRGNLCLFGMTGAERRRVMTDFSLQAVGLPFIPDPDRLRAEDVRAIEQLLAGQEGG